MKVVLLAGGRGSRLSEETQLRPKPMVEIGGHPILWHIMMMYWSHGFRDFIICLGYRGYFIKEYFANYVLHRSDVTIDLASHQVEYVRSQQLPPWRVTLVDTGAETQTGGRLRRIAHLLPDGEPFCMTYGDGVSDVDIRALVAFHKGHGLDATLTVVVLIISAPSSKDISSIRFITSIRGPTASGPSSISPTLSGCTWRRRSFRSAMAETSACS